MKYLFILLLAGCATLPPVTTVRCDMGDAPILGSIRLINDFVNGFKSVPDIINYGASEYYASPKEFFKNGGDCEDYAIAKYCMIKREKLAGHMVLLRSDGHMVLVADGMVLDNLTGHILPVNDPEITKRYDIIGEIIK